MTHGALIPMTERELAERARYRAEDLAGLLDDLARFFERFVVFQHEEQLDAVTLWAAHSHVVDATSTTLRLSVRSPEKESGKTRVLEVLELLVPEPLFVHNTTEAALFRLVAEGTRPFCSMKWTRRSGRRHATARTSERSSTADTVAVPRWRVASAMAPR